MKSWYTTVIKNNLSNISILSVYMDLYMKSNRPFQSLDVVINLRTFCTHRWKGRNKPTVLETKFIIEV